MAKTNDNGSITLRIPTPLRAYTDRQSSVTLHGATVVEVLADLVERYPALRKHLLDDDGRLRSFVNLYLNGEDIHVLGGVETPLSPGDKLAIIPAIAGGVGP
jgi:molybdopterin synthase sulfur carrier subunit